MIIHDLAIIGSGVTGLSAAICAASEGLSVIVLETDDKGGQAGSASLVENLIGYPEGISGIELNSKSRQQCLKFGVEFLTCEVITIVKDDIFYLIKDDVFYLTKSKVIKSKSVLIAVGSSYSKLDIEGVDKFIGKGITYGSPDITKDYSNKTIVVVGGANSAGQAAIFLSQFENCNVTLLLRNDSIHDKMSEYLCVNIHNTPIIRIIHNAEISELFGHETLEGICVHDDGGFLEITDVDELFLLIGTEPNTSNFQSLLQLDEVGFIKTGSNVHYFRSFGTPLYMETSIKGIFAAGDCRLGSVKRIISSMGEGGRVVNEIKDYLTNKD